MITIANCPDLQEAIRLRMLLESCEIEAFIPDEFSATGMPHHFMTKTGIRLQVAEESVEEAQAILQDDKKTMAEEPQ